MSIKHWPENERPREKLLRFGARALSDAELLAILLRTGIAGMSAVDLARYLIQHFGSLSALMNADADTLCQCKGMGMASFTQFAVVREIGRRLLAAEMRERPLLADPQDVADYLRLYLGHEPIEVCVALLLDQHNRLLHTIEVTRGTVNANTVYIRELAKLALQHHAVAVIVAHNHPAQSGEPSREDILLTRDIKQALALLDIVLLDHFIVTAHTTTSLAELGHV